LISAAEPTTSLDAADPAVTRAMAGDTVTGIRTAGAVPEVFVLMAPRRSDPPGSVRFARAPLQPRAAALVGSASGYATALYLNGHRWAGTEPPPGPEALPRPLPASLAAGAVVALGGNRDDAPLLAALVVPSSPPRHPLALPLLPVFGLLLVFATLAARGQITGHTGRRRSLGRFAWTVLLALVPALTAGAFQVQVGRLLQERARRTVVTDVAHERAAKAALAGAGASASPAAFTGLGAGGDDAARGPDAADAVERFQRRSRGIALALGAWLVLVGGTAARRSRRGLSS